MGVQNNTQRFQGFVRDLQESFWGDFQERTREALKKLLEADAQKQMADYLGLKWHERDYVTPLGAIRLRIPRTRPRWCSLTRRVWIGSSMRFSASLTRRGLGEPHPRAICASSMTSPAAGSVREYSARFWIRA
jgi:hypothetical protein